MLIELVSTKMSAENGQLPGRVVTIATRYEQMSVFICFRFGTCISSNMEELHDRSATACSGVVAEEVGSGLMQVTTSAETPTD
jgi:hypothetical protein